MEKHVCCICGKEFSGYGNNPEPVKLYEEGQCCVTSATAMSSFLKGLEPFT